MRRPWNNVNFPVYSLSTKSEQTFNMNICTYVSPVSMHPKMYCIALDYKTLTYDFVNNSNKAVLQFLNSSHKPIVKPLGKKSGFSFDKIEYLNNKSLLKDWESFKVIDNCNAYLLLEKQGSENINGDHELFWFTVIKTKNVSDKNSLYNQDLIDAKIIL